jgi:excisionase family DNA binding protein
MVDPVDELRAAAARLKRDIEDLVRKIEELPRSDIGDTERTEEEMLLIASRAIDAFETRPRRPVHVTIKQAAEMLGLSRHTVSKMLTTGELRYNRCGRIPIEQIDMALARSKR